MTTGTTWAVDTSVAVPALNGDHPLHRLIADVVRQRRPAIAGHAAFETFSVLTRLPGMLNISATVASQVLDLAFPQRYWLSAEETGSLFGRLGSAGISGGSVYDALVGEAVRVAGATLITRDRRAQHVYDLLGVHYELLAQ